MPVLSNILQQFVSEKLGEDSPEVDILSWENSLRYMADEVNNKKILFLPHGEQPKKSSAKKEREINQNHIRIILPHDDLITSN